MESLERKKKEVELKKIDAAIAELEYKIAEKEADIKRMLEHVELQKQRKQKVTEELNQ